MLNRAGYVRTHSQAEMDILAQHAEKHCVGASVPTRLCEKIRTQAANVRNALAKLASSQVGDGYTAIACTQVF